METCLFFHEPGCEKWGAHIIGEAESTAEWWERKTERNSKGSQARSGQVPHTHVSTTKTVISNTVNMQRGSWPCICAVFWFSQVPVIAASSFLSFYVLSFPTKIATLPYCLEPLQHRLEGYWKQWWSKPLKDHVPGWGTLISQKYYSGTWGTMRQIFFPSLPARFMLQAWHTQVLRPRKLYSPFSHSKYKDVTYRQVSGRQLHSKQIKRKTSISFSWLLDTSLP